MGSWDFSLTAAGACKHGKRSHGTLDVNGSVEGKKTEEVDDDQGRTGVFDRTVATVLLVASILFGEPPAPTVLLQLAQHCAGAHLHGVLSTKAHCDTRCSCSTASQRGSLCFSSKLLFGVRAGCPYPSGGDAVLNLHLKQMWRIHKDWHVILF